MGRVEGREYGADVLSRALWLRPSSAEWVRAWDRMKEWDGSDGLDEHPESGEVWQYMGTWNVDGKWAHEFRHRDHPRHGGRWTHRVVASPGWLRAKGKTITPTHRAAYDLAERGS